MFILTFIIICLCTIITQSLIPSWMGSNVMATGGNTTYHLPSSGTAKWNTAYLNLICPTSGGSLFLSPAFPPFHLFLHFTEGKHQVLDFEVRASVWQPQAMIRIGVLSPFVHLTLCRQRI